MRSFSNIMTNFAGNLHLLVDSILFSSALRKTHFFVFLFGDFIDLLYICTRFGEKSESQEH